MRYKLNFTLGVLCAIFLVAQPAAAVKTLAGPDEIVTSAADDRIYRAIELDNGLRVMLVSDPAAERSAAALDVHVGSGHDPIERQGLAHYLEHMLFLGTEKYPEAGEYQAYISEHGGSNNAYTVLEHTNYFFNITPEYFEGALDRFSQFFIAPLFNEQYVSRERAIVDSEFRARKNDEGRRLWAARREIYNPEHPRTKYSVGNQTTLADRTGDPVREDLIDFYQRYYHAPRMALSVLGPQSLDQLQTWVEEKFSSISSDGEGYEPFDMPLVLPDFQSVQLRLKPIKDTRKITFSFPIPAVQDKTETKPAQYVSNLLGHEGEGSLLALLKARTWATSLSAGLGYSDSVQASFDITIGLSALGMQHLEEIGSLLFAYIDLVREEGIKPVYYEELKQLAELDFRFQEKGSESSLVQGIASRLHRYAPQGVLSQPYLISRFAPAEISALLEQMTPSHLQIVIVDPELAGSHTTRWYDVDFKIEPIDAAWLRNWSTAEPEPGLALPGANPFVPDQLEMLSGEQENNLPRLLDTPVPVRVWHQTELKFGQPKAEMYFSLRSPVANSDPLAAVLTELYVKSVREQLNALSYLAYLAGLNYRIYPHSRGLSVRISGYSARQSVLLEKVIAVMLSPQVSRAQFDLYVENLRQSLENSVKGRPSTVVMGGVYDALLSSSWSAQEKLSVLASLDMETLKQHGEALLESPELLLLSVGNVRPADSLKAAEIVARLNPDKPGKEVARARVRKLKTGQMSLVETAAQPDDGAIALVYQGTTASVEEVAATQLLGALIHTPFYQALRTEGEIGYIVHAYAFNVLDTPALAFSVQSNSHSINEITAQARDFLNTFHETLAEMPEESFVATRAGLIAQISEKDKQLSELASRYWAELDREAYNFDSRERLLAAIRKLDRPTLLNYYRTLVGDDQGAALLSYSFGKQSDTLELKKPPEIVTYGSLQALRQSSDEFF